jgi:hypothetical protein
VSIGKPSSSPKKWSFHGSLGLEKSETCENIGMKGENERNDLEEVEVARVHTVETISDHIRCNEIAWCNRATKTIIL